MPLTVNGIGTKYCGKKNLRAYEGQCAVCRRMVQLQEYETRLWIVVIYVPVIPLGRKQVLDDCTVCQQHRAIPLAAWEKVKEEAIAERTKSFSENPDDPQVAIDLLQTLSGFSRFDEAERLAQGIQQRFDDDPSVQHQMGQWHEFRDRPDEAQQCYRKALELDPKHPGAKRAIALAMIAAGQLPAARALLSAEPAIGPSDDPTLYVELAKAHQQRNEHSEALDTFDQVLAAAPTLHGDEAMRKLVRESEKQVPERESILASKPLYRHPAAIVAALVLVVLAAILGSNFYIATHRTLHLVNGFNRPVELQLDDGSPIALAPNSHQTHTLAEGPHRTTVTLAGQPLDSDEFEIRTGFWDRFFDDTVYVLNAGRGAVVVWEQTTFSVNPVGGGTARLEAGRALHSFANVDYHFVDFPETLDLPEGRPLTKTRVGVLPLVAAQIFLLDETTIEPDDQLAFAEAHLAVTPEDRELLGSYVRLAAETGQFARARSFVLAGLDKTPVRVEWHRMADGLTTTPEETDGLRRRYAEWLDKEPNNSNVLYLSGRLQSHSAEAMEYFDRAIEADPENPYPWIGKSYHLALWGDFAAAKVACEKALARKLGDADVAAPLFEMRLALGEYAGLLREVREEIREAPLDFNLHVRHLELLVAQGKLPDARHANDVYVAAIRAAPEVGEEADIAMKFAGLKMHYLTRDYGGMVADAGEPEFADVAAELRFVAHLETDKCAEAAAELEAEGFLPDPFDELNLSIAWRLAGDDAKGDEWQARACARLRDGVVDHQLIATLLENPAEINWQDIDDIHGELRHKATVLVVLAQQSPDERGKLLTLADKLNYERKYPYHFLSRAIETLRETE